VAAEMGMEELHEKRTDFVQKVQNAVSSDLEKNGLELETVSLTALDQTDKQFFNADNAFDAQGLTILTETIESKKKVRNDIEQNTSVAIRKKNLEAEKERIELQKEEEFAKATQKREIANQAAQEASTISKEKSDNDRIAQEAEIEAQQRIQTTKIKADKEVEQEKIQNELIVKEKDIKREETIEIANQTRDIAIAEKSKEKSKAEKEAKEAEALTVSAEEKVVTARQTEIANRNKEIAVIKATEIAEQEAVGVKVAATAKKVAALDEAEAVKTEAQASAEAVKIKALADEQRYRVDAEGKEKANEAENKLSEAIIKMRVQIETIKNAADIIEASVKPMESIEGIKIVNVSGLGGLVGSGSDTGTKVASSDGNFAEQLVNSLLKYRAMTPVVDSILKEVGIEAGSIEGLTKVLKNQDTPEPSKKQSPKK